MITVISGTNRPESKSIQVALYYQNLLKERNAETQLIDLSHLPQDFIFTALYGKPQQHPEFFSFVEKINQSEKFVFIVPEYNISIPGILKAFIDGLDYTTSFQNKKCAMVGISSGTVGGAIALSHLTDILNYLGMHTLAIKPRLPKIESLMQNGEIKDKFITELLNKQADELVAF